jgi:hypothetical protein
MPGEGSTCIIACSARAKTGPLAAGFGQQPTATAVTPERIPFSFSVGELPLPLHLNYAIEYLAVSLLKPLHDGRCISSSETAVRRLQE